MSGLNSLRSLLTRSLRQRQCVPARKPSPIGRGMECLEDRITPVIAMSLSGTTATVTGDTASDTLRITVDTTTIGGPFLVHNRFTAGDTGFATNLDFNSTVAGEQRLLASAASTVQVSNLGAGDDTLQIVRGANGTTGSGDLNAAILVDNLGADSGDSITVDDSTRSVAATYLYSPNDVKFTGPGYDVELSAFHFGGFFLTTGAAADTVDVQGTFGNSQEVVLNSAGGADTVNVTGSTPGSLAGLDSDVVIRNTPSFSIVNIDGSTDATLRTATLDTATLPAFAGQTFGRLTTSADTGGIYYAINGSRGVSDVNINFGTGVTNLTINQTNAAAGVLTTDITFGDAADTVSVQAVATNAVTSLTTGGGGDTITFANGSSLNGGTVDGGAGTDAINYAAYTTPIAVNLGLGVSGLSAEIGGGQEVPSIGTASAGFATIGNYNTATKTFDLSMTVTDLAPAEVTGLFLQRGGLGAIGEVIIDLIALGTLTPSGTGFTLNIAGVDLNASLLGGAANEAAFLGGQTYLSIFTAAFPDALIRGQVLSTGNVLVANGTATGTGGVSNIENITGGSAADSLIGSSAANVLNGSGGNDFLLGGPGADTFNGGADTDTMIWSNGDGTDVMNGDAGTDTVSVNGNMAANDVFTIGANGTRIDFDRVSPGPFSLDIGTTERLRVNGGAAGGDSFTVNDLAGVADLFTLNVFGLAGDDTFNITPAASVTIMALAGAGYDTLSVNLGGSAGPALTNDPDAAGGFEGDFAFSNREGVFYFQMESPLAENTLAVGGSTAGAAAVLAPLAGVFPTDPTSTVTPFAGFSGNVRTATGDVDDDGFADTIFVTGPGAAIRVAVISGADNSVLVAPFDPFGGNFTGGGFVAAADIDGDGRAEFAVTPDQGGGPRVSIFSLLANSTVETKANFFGIDDEAFRGGARAASGDIDNDNTPDLLLAAGFGGGPRVAVFDGDTLLTTRTKLVPDFFAFPEDANTLRNGVFAALGDINGDGFDDLVFGGGPGGGPRVYVLSGQLLMTGSPNLFSQPVANFFVAGNDTDRGGVRLAVKNADGDSKADLVVGSGAGSPAKVRVYLGSNFTGTGEPATFQDITVFGGLALADGVYVG